MEKALCPGSDKGLLFFQFRDSSTRLRSLRMTKKIFPAPVGNMPHVFRKRLISRIATPPHNCQAHHGVILSKRSAPKDLYRIGSIFAMPSPNCTDPSTSPVGSAQDDRACPPNACREHAARVSQTFDFTHCRAIPRLPIPPRCHPERSEESLIFQGIKKNAR